MRHERRKPHDGVVAPVGSAIGLPPGAADGVGAHAEPHAELEDARERAGRRHADHQALQDAEPRIGLHHAHERSTASAVMTLSASSMTANSWSLPQRSQKSRMLPALKPSIVRAATVGERDAPAPGGGERREARVLGGGERRLAGVAEHVDMEAVADAVRGETSHHRVEQADHLVRRLVADAQQDRGRGGDRLVAAHAPDNRRDRGDRIARKRMIRSPMVAFQKPITYQGSVTVKRTTRRRSTRPEAAGRKRDHGEPDEAGNRQSDQATKNNRRPPSRARDGPRHGLLSGNRSSMQALFRVFSGVYNDASTPTTWIAGRSPADMRKVVTRMRGKALWYVGPGRAELREEPVAEPGIRRGAGAGALRRHQPRHRAAGPCRPGAGERARAHARALHGRRVSVSGQVRLRHGRAGRGRAGGPARSARLLPASAPERVHASGRGGVSRSRATSRRSAPCSRPIWRPRSTPCGMARPGPADRIAIVGGGLVGLLVAYLCAQLPGTEVTVVDIAPSRAAVAHLIGARFAAPVSAPADCDLVFHASANAGRTCHRAAARRRRGAHRRAELVRQRRHRRSARRSVPQPPAAARFEPGRQGRALAPAALDAWAPPGGGARAAARPRRSTRCSRRPSIFEDLPASLSGDVRRAIRRASAS